VVDTEGMIEEVIEGMIEEVIEGGEAEGKEGITEDVVEVTITIRTMMMVVVGEAHVAEAEDLTVQVRNLAVILRLLKDLIKRNCTPISLKIQTIQTTTKQQKKLETSKRSPSSTEAGAEEVAEEEESTEENTKEVAIQEDLIRNRPINAMKKPLAVSPPRISSSSTRTTTREEDEEDEAIETTITGDGEAAMTEQSNTSRDSRLEGRALDRLRRTQWWTMVTATFLIKRSNSKTKGTRTALLASTR